MSGRAATVTVHQMRQQAGRVILGKEGFYGNRCKGLVGQNPVNILDVVQIAGIKASIGGDDRPVGVTQGIQAT